MDSYNQRKGVQQSSFDWAAWLVVPPAVAITLVCHAGNFQQMHRTSVADQDSSGYRQPPHSNDAVKVGWPTQASLQTIEDTPTYVLASAPQTAVPVALPVDAVIATGPNIPAAVPVPEPKTAASAGRALPPDGHIENPKHLLPPSPSSPGPVAQRNLLDDSQISGLRGRLRLTTDQIEYWPVVETALREVVRTQLRGTKHSPGTKMNIDVNSPAVQRLIWAAMPLLMRLRDDQKSEIRRLAHMIGLDQVASQI